MLVKLVFCLLLKPLTYPLQSQVHAKSLVWGQHSALDVSVAMQAFDKSLRVVSAAAGQCQAGDTQQHNPSHAKYYFLTQGKYNPSGLKNVSGE